MRREGRDLTTWDENVKKSQIKESIHAPQSCCLTCAPEYYFVVTVCSGKREATSLVNMSWGCKAFWSRFCAFVKHSAT